MTYTCVNTPPTGDSRIINTRYIMGFIVQSGSDVEGVNLTAIRWSIRADSGSTGTLYCKLYNSTSTIPTALHTFGSVDVSTIASPSTFTDVDFTTPMTGTLSAGNMIGLEYENTSSPNIHTEVISSSDAQGLFFEYDSGSGVATVTNRSPYYCYTGGASGGSTGFPPPPIVVHF